MSIALRDPPDLAGRGRRHRRPPGGGPLGLAAVPPRMAPAAARARPAHRGGRRDDLGHQRRHERAAPEPQYATFGTAAAQVTLPGTDPHLAADIAAIQGRWGPADLIENQNITTGTTQSVQLRAENPHGHYNSPLLSLVSGTYPAGPGQVALTSQVASLYGAHVGGTWQAAGTTWRVTGIVQDPSNLADEFALVAPGQVTHPSQVIMLLGSPAVQQAISDGNGTLPGVPAATCHVSQRRRAGSRRRRASWWWRYSAWCSSAWCRWPASP